ncbi:MAG: NAD(P)-dependent glycerol-3-phosphate dehydrogenase, partial [Veillonella sp.]|nr:NAD(P)-dependent glycerol-3-phosphate dehydrogenase [Veillonella sp.]
LPGVILPNSLQITSDLGQVMDGTHMVLMVTPSTYVRQTAAMLAPYLKEGTIVILCSKGMEKDSQKLLTEVVAEELDPCGIHLVALSGPNHAEEIARNLPAASVIAAPHMDLAHEVCVALSSPDFRLYASDDMIGLELAAATKNIIALAGGVLDGLALGDNSKALLLTRGLHEMTRFGLALGAKRETYAGLAGMGDLIATCMSRHSRNRNAGEALAKGQSMQDIIGATNMVVEGFNAVSIVYGIAQEKGIDMPITNALYRVLFQGLSVEAGIAELMGRDIKVEAH